MFELVLLTTEPLNQLLVIWSLNGTTTAFLMAITRNWQDAVIGEVASYTSLRWQTCPTISRL